jgi:putative ABC transport system ATP-binding protein
MCAAAVLFTSHGPQSARRSRTGGGVATTDALTSTTAPGQAGALAILQHFAQTLGIGFDPTRAAQAVRAAEREVPPTAGRAARTRLAQAAAALGMDLVARRLSVREASRFVSQGVPLAVFTVVPGGSARWFLLIESTGSRVRLEPISPGDEGGWVPPEELAKRLGTTGQDVVLEWYLAEPITTMGEASVQSSVEVAAHAGHAPGAHGGHGHGHGHGAHAPHLPPLRRLLGLLRPDARDIGIVTVFAVGVGLFTLATPVVAMAVVNTVALGTLVQQLIVLCVALFFALAVAGLLTFFQSIVVEFIQRRLFVRIAADLGYRLPRVDLCAFDRQHGPELVNRFFDVLTVQKAAATLLLDGITIALQVLIGLLLLGFYHTYLLGFDLFLIVALLFLFTLLSRGAVRTAVSESIAKYAVAGWMEEIARHPIAFKAAGGPQLALERTDTLTRQYLLRRSEHFRILMRQIAFALVLQALANVALLGIGGMLVIQGDLLLGELVAAQIVVTMVVATFTKFGKQLEAYYDILAATDKLGHLIDLPLERSGGARHEAHSDGAAVVAHDVSFRYDGGHRDALAHVSLALAPGERVALMGPNGSGKSTLVDVLFGLRQPTHGWIELDGMDLREMNLDTVREHVALVDRIEVFEGTVLENIRMGRDDVTVADVRDALKRVGLLHTIQEFPDGLDTMLWPGGHPLSLGQANRLMLARALVGQPRLLILDESLDHMDADIRETVIPAIMNREAHWTLLIVTHSEDVGRLCDRTIRLERAHGGHGPEAHGAPHAPDHHGHNGHNGHTGHTGHNGH